MENKMKISGNELTDIINKCGEENHVQPFGCDVEWLGYTIHIKRFLNFKDMMGFVNGVTSGCFAKSDNSYLPEARDFFFRCYIVESYTNVELPDTLEERNQLIYGSNIVDVILQYIDISQFNAIIDAIDKKVSALVDMKVKQINDEAEFVYQQINNLYTRLSDVFSGIDKGTIQSVVKALSELDIDEKKLVDAVISANNPERPEKSSLKAVKKS